MKNQSSSNTGIVPEGEWEMQIRHGWCSPGGSFDVIKSLNDLVNKNFIIGIFSSVGDFPF